MHIPRKAKLWATSAVVLLGMVGAASAAQAVATGNVNVRSGPSTQYGRVDTLLRNEVVDVTSCQGNWCYVEKRGADGWVSANYLQPVYVGGQRRPSVGFSFNFGNAPVVRPPRHRHYDYYDDYYDYRDRWHRRPSSGFSLHFGN